MEDNQLTPIAKGLRYLEYRGWTDLIDPRWTIDVKEELEKSGLELTEDEILEVCQLCLSPHPDWNTKERLTIIDWPTLQEQIFNAIRFDGFTKHTLELIDNYTSDILNGRTNFTQFNLQEHAGVCSADSVLIGAYTVACYARRSFSSSYYVAKGERSPANWEIDEAQEKCVQQWAEAKNLWFPNSKTILSVSFGPMIAQGAEAKVYYKAGETSVIKERTSIYSTLGRAFEAIILHNTLFPETQMRVIGFTRDSDGLFRTILTQPYIECKRLATKEEIDELVANKGFRDNREGKGVNYISDRLYLEDMHPANVFIDKESEKSICIDCIVKFVKP